MSYESLSYFCKTKRRRIKSPFFLRCVDDCLCNCVLSCVCLSNCPVVSHYACVLRFYMTSLCYAVPIGSIDRPVLKIF